MRRLQPPTWTQASVLALSALAVAYSTRIWAQAPTPDKIRPVNYTQKGNAPTGPSQVVIEHDQGLATHTIYRPTNLTSKHPLVVWGEGGCAKNGLTFPEYLSEIASYGFVVVADGPPVQNAGGPAGAKGGAAKGGGAKGGPPDAAKGKGPAPGAAAAKGKGAPGGRGNMTDGSALIAAIDWMEKEVKDPTSRFYQKVDATRVAAVGMSCGGLMSYGASADPRIATVGIWNSGLFEKDQKIIGGIHSSVIIVTGGESDIAYANGKSDYEVMPPRVPIFYGVYPSVGHGGTYNLDNGGPFGQVAVAWLKWQLQGDDSAKGKGYFVGPQCTLCTDSNWQVQSRSLR